MRLYFNRFFRAARLDVSFYQEVAAEPLLLNQAWITVLLYAMLASWGSFGRAGAVGSNIGMISALIGWYIWAFSSYFIATRLFRAGSSETQRAERKAVIRAMGFACAPGVIRLLGMIPGLGIAVLVLSSIWMIVAATIAIKAALNFENTARAAGACIIGWIIGVIAQGLLLLVLFSVFGVTRS
ncbi:MAG: YIP1 family protein [Desulfobacterales bacterium]|jgi:hypothetical protein